MGHDCVVGGRGRGYFLFNHQWVMNLSLEGGHDLFNPESSMDHECLVAGGHTLFNTQYSMVHECVIEGGHVLFNPQSSMGHEWVR